MLQPSEDHSIIKKLRKGDVLSFDMVYEKYHKRVYYFALGYLKSREDAEEVVQEVFLNLWKSRDQIKEHFVFSRYLFRITFNSIHKVFRKQTSDRKHLEQFMKDIVIEDDSTNIDIEYDNLLETANSYIEKLPARQKLVFQLSISEHLTNEEIAKRFNISKKTVDNYISDARAFLKKSFIDGRLISVLFFYLFLK